MAQADIMVMDQTFKNGGIDVKWTSFGSGQPLIFLHGTPWSSQLWLPIAKCFAQDYTVYMYDLPGYGQSISTQVKESNMTYPEQTRTFCAILDHWAAVRGEAQFKPHIMAHDIGGHIALRAHFMGNRDFKSLVLVDCGASQPVNEPFFSLVRENPAVFTSLPAELHEALIRRYIRGASFKGLRPDQEAMLVEPYLSADGQRLFYTQIGAQKNEDIETLRQAYRRVDVPLHIIWAANDTWVPVERAQMLQEQIGGTRKIIDGAGHLIQMDAPEQLIWELSAWFGSLNIV